MYWKLKHKRDLRYPENIALITAMEHFVIAMSKQEQSDSMLERDSTVEYAMMVSYKRKCIEDMVMDKMFDPTINLTCEQRYKLFAMFLTESIVLDEKGKPSKDEDEEKEEEIVGPPEDPKVAERKRREYLS